MVVPYQPNSLLLAESPRPWSYRTQIPIAWQGRVRLLLSKAVVILLPDSKEILDARKPEGESYDCVSGCYLPHNFCFLYWVTIPTCQLAAMARVQVITETGIRWHKNLHVYNCLYLPQQNLQQRHHLLTSQVWHSEQGTLEVTSAHFSRGRQPHTRPCISLFPKKALTLNHHRWNGSSGLPMPVPACPST